MINKSNKNSRDILASIATQKIFKPQKIKEGRFAPLFNFPTLGNSKEKMIHIKPKNVVAGEARHNIFGFNYFV